MKNFLYLACVALLTTLASCAPRVNVEQRANVDFSRYRTFAFAETKVKTTGDANPVYHDPIAQDRIQQAIASELMQRGLRQVRAGAKPDFYVSTHFYIDNAERTVANPTYPGAGFAYPYSVYYGGGFLPVNYGYYYSPAYYQSPTYHTETYKEGTLIIDFIDSRTNNLVWRGSLADPLDNGGLGRQFAGAARDILDKFPVEEKKG